MGGQRKVWCIRSTTVAAILALLSVCNSSAAIYRISSDEIIEDDDSPPIDTGWRWSRVEQTTPRPRTNVYPKRVPTYIEETDELPDGWKMALRRAAYQSLRQEAGILLGYPGITPSIQDNVNRELWYRLSIAEFVGTKEYQEYDEEELQSDISTLVEGLLIHKDGDLQFYVTHRQASCACEGARTLATWSIRRLRHSGPGRGRPQYQLHFSVIPVGEEQSVDVIPVRVEPVGPNLSPKYRGIPIFNRNGHKEYNPNFIAEYGRVINTFLRQRDIQVKHHPRENNREHEQHQYRQNIPTYESNEPSREEYQEHYSENYPKYQPQEDTTKEYHHYQGSQQNSRSQYHRYYRERYTSYQPHQETKGHYHQHQYRDQYTDFHQHRPIIREFRPSPQYERFSESDPLFENDSDDQKAVSQVIIAQHQPLSQGTLDSVKAAEGIPTVGVYHKEWQQEDYKTEDSSYKSADSTYRLEISKENNSFAQDFPIEWTQTAALSKSQVKESHFVSAGPTTTLQPPINDDYQDSEMVNDGQTNKWNHEKTSTNKFPIGSQSLAALVRVTEHENGNYNSKRFTIKNTRNKER